MSKIATVVFESNKYANNSQKLKTLNRIVDSIDADIFVFPGGYFSAGQRKAGSVYGSLASGIYAQDSIVCAGVDGYDQKPWPRDQTAIAISNSEVIAAARKFYSAPTEQKVILSKFEDLENDLPRVFFHRGKNYFLAVCYDAFGVRHKDIKNPGADAMIDHIHGFFPKGQSNSGENYFARHGLAGASKQWSVPVFAATTFFNRSIPENWPSGVLWDSGEKSTCHWSYSENALVPESTEYLQTISGGARISIYHHTT